MAVADSSLFGYYEFTRNLYLLSEIVTGRLVLSILVSKSVLLQCCSYLRFNSKYFGLLVGASTGGCLVPISLFGVVVLLNVGQISAKRSHILVSFIDKTVVVETSPCSPVLANSCINLGLGVLVVTSCSLEVRVES